MALLTGKAVVVTGSGKGLGRAYALEAAQHGASVVVNDVDEGAARDVVDTISTAGGVALANFDSVASWEGAEALVAACVERFGKIDGLVNNAGIFHVCDPWDEQEARVRRIVEVNLLGPMFCGIHAMRAMLPTNHGSIVNVASRAQMGIALMSSYGATKGGVASLTYTWALDLAGTNIRVNAISPSARTGLGVAYREFLAERSKTSQADTTTVPSRPEVTNPLRRPEDNAPLVTYLLSDRAVGISGQVIGFSEVGATERRLALYTHPVLSQARVNREQWTADDVARAFDEKLRADLQPVGGER